MQKSWSIDYDAQKDLNDLMTDSQDWWPADFGHYGPFFIRMAWLPVLRTADGRGGGEPVLSALPHLTVGLIMEFGPNSTLVANQAKIRPQNFWADLFILTGNVAPKSMGFKTFGWWWSSNVETEDDIYWGTEGAWLDDSVTPAGVTLKTHWLQYKWDLSCKSEVGS